MLERVYKGEIAILKEIQSQRTATERKDALTGLTERLNASTDKRLSKNKNQLNVKDLEKRTTIQEELMSPMSSFSSSEKSDSEGSEQQLTKENTESYKGFEEMPLFEAFRKQTITTKVEDTQIVIQGRTSVAQASEVRVSTYTGTRHLSVKVPTRLSFLE